MTERYHLLLAALALGAGLALSLWAVVAPQLRPHLVALAATSGVLLAPDTPSIIRLAFVAAAGASLWWGQDRPPPEHPLGRWVGPAFVLSIAGVWAGVPDTEAAVAALGIAAPLSVLALATNRSVARTGWLWACAWLTATVWTGAAGWGPARATVCAVALVGTAPLVRGFGRPWGGRVLVAGLGVHAVLAIAGPRLVMRLEPGPAAAVSLSLLLTAAGASAVLGSRGGSGNDPH